MVATTSYSLEDAIKATKFGKFNYSLIVLAGLILGCAMLETNCINMVIPIAACELNMTNFHKGLLGSVGYVGIILSSHLWGFLADTRGRRKVIVPALLLAFFFTICSTFSKNFWFLAIFRFLNGFCICGPQTIIYAFLGEFHPAENRARVLIVASVMYGIFCLINPLNGILFLNRETWSIHIPLLDLDYNAWRIFLLMSSVPSFVSALVMLAFIPESPKFTFAQGDEARTLRILNRVYECNTGRSDFQVTSLIKDKEFEEAQSGAGGRRSFFAFMLAQTVPLFKSPHLKNTLTACFLQFGLCVACNGFWTFFPEIINKVLLWMESEDATSATICSIIKSFDGVTNEEKNSTACVTRLELSTLATVSILTLLYSVLWFIISMLINRTGKLAIIVIVMFTSGTASFSLMFVTIPQASLFIYLLLLLAGLNISIVNSSTVELFPTTLRAMAVALSMMVGRIGSVLGSNFVGLAIKNFCTYTWILPAVLLISGGLLSFTIPNISKRHSK